MVEASIKKIVEELSSPETLDIISNMAADDDNNSSYNNKLKGHYAINTKYNNPHETKMPNEFGNALSTELTRISDFIDQEESIENSNPILLYAVFVYGMSFVQNYLRVMEDLNDYDIKFCLAIAETYLDNIITITTKTLKRDVLYQGQGEFKVSVYMYIHSLPHII